MFFLEFVNFLKLDRFGGVFVRVYWFSWILFCFNFKLLNGFIYIKILEFKCLKMLVIIIIIFRVFFRFLKGVC